MVEPVSQAYRLEFLLNPEEYADESKSEDNFEGFARTMMSMGGDVGDNYEFGFPSWDDESRREVEMRTPTDENGLITTTVAHTGSLQLDSNQRSGRTNMWFGGYQYTRAATTENKIYYRCSYNRSSGCKGKCHFVTGLQQYTNFSPHTCGRSAAPNVNGNECAGSRVDVTESMKHEVDKLAMTTSYSRRDIWDIIRAKYFGHSNPNVAYVGLTMDAVIRRVNRIRDEGLGGNVFSRIEAAPWSQVLNDRGTVSGVNFFLFHYSYFDKVKKRRERLLGWGHPVLIYMLNHKKTNVFVDGTFRSVPSNFKQCVIFSTYDRPLLPCCFRTLYI